MVLEAKNSSDPICQAYKLKSIAETQIKGADGRIWRSKQGPSMEPEAGLRCSTILFGPNTPNSEQKDFEKLIGLWWTLGLT